MAKKSNKSNEVTYSGADAKLAQKLMAAEKERLAVARKREAAVESRPENEVAEKCFKAAKVGDLVSVWDPELGEIPTGLVIDRVRTFVRKGERKGTFVGEELHVWSPSAVGTATDYDGKEIDLHIIVCQAKTGARITRVGQAIKLPATVKAR